MSIGYSTCHWCHVMARESFEDDTVAQAVNAAFLPVKVDREERPGAAGRELLRQAVSQFANIFDSKWGGFGSAPKFPTPTI